LEPPDFVDFFSVDADLQIRLFRSQSAIALSSEGRELIAHMTSAQPVVNSSRL
jgi:hypothetical protein